MKGSFEAERIRNIPPDHCEQGYQFVSFDMTSQFTNILLHRTFNVILKRVYKESSIKTKLIKSALKKLISDSCKKTGLSFDDNIYEQIDRVSLGSSLGPVLSSIIIF